MILLASPSTEALDRWERGLQGLVTRRIRSDIDSVQGSLSRLTPEVLVLDLDSPGLRDPAAVTSLRKSSRASKIIATGNPVSDEMELALFKVGVRGCCRTDIEPQVLKRAVLAVQLGELWMRRSLTSRLLDELGVQSDDSTQSRRTVGRFAYLTQREQEIAALIADGGSNKQIARRLAISERTVKAHLTEIFRKLGVGDRLKLALLWVGSYQA